MRNFFYIIALVAILLPGWSGEEAPAQPELPATVVRALDTYDAEVQKAQDDYRKAVDRAKDKAARTIEREQERATRDGNLEGALAIKSKAEELEKHNPGGLAKLDILGNKIKEERATKIKPLLGRWDCIPPGNKSSYHWEFTQDGEITGGARAYRWKIEKKCLIVYDDARPVVMTFPFPIVEKGWKGTHTDGKQYNLVKQ